jgi:hypothetical protein
LRNRIKCKRVAGKRPKLLKISNNIFWAKKVEVVRTFGNTDVVFKPFGHFKYLGRQMTRPITAIVLFLFSCVLFSCSSTRNISGVYKSNFGVGGFFGTTVRLYSDSNFTFRMSGDLAYDTAAGHFQVYKKSLILIYKTLAIDTSLEYQTMKESFSIHEAITGNHNLREPTIYLIGNNKLFLIDKNGLKVKRQWGYSKHKKYLLFGKHWYMKRYYLRRVE